MKDYYKKKKDKNFSENDIRPRNFDEKKIIALEEDIKRLRSKLNQFLYVDCPACKSKNNKFEFIKYNFNFVICEDCGTVFMNPRPSKEILDEFYSKSILYEYWDKYIFPASRQIRREKIFRPRVDKIYKLCEIYDIPKECIIEVGSASGMFTEELKLDNFFKRIIGIEPCKAQAQTSRDKGIEVIESTIEKIKSVDQKANIVASFETIEHLFSPDLFLKCCRNIMADEGLLVITCPNYQGFDITMMGTESESLDHEHINLFNPNSIQILFERNNFEIIEIITPGKLDAEIVRNYFLKNNLEINLNKFLRKILINEWDKYGENFQKFLSDNQLSSHMWVVGQKK